MKIRRANQEDFETIFMMGFDTWADGATSATYLQGCHSSSKYARGTWYVLEEKGLLLCSLILYRIEESVYGIGSIATPPSLRKKGFASQLIQETLKLIESDTLGPIVFLYSDIEFRFYERFGFVPLPSEYQKRAGSTCMVWPRTAISQISSGMVKVPKYF